MNTPTAQDLSAAIDQSIKTLAAETDAAKQNEAFRLWLTTMSRFYSYSFGNQMLIAFQCPTATRVAGFRRWQSMNRFVRKGEKGIRILAPIIRRKEDETTKDGKTSRIAGFRVASVFDRLSRDLRPARPATVLRRRPPRSCVRLDGSSHIIAQFAGSLQGGLDTDEFQFAGSDLSGGFVVSFCCV
jgi:N-terminal domain of anti-restriction factor ArdC